LSVIAGAEPLTAMPPPSVVDVLSRIRFCVIEASESLA
jgi:hypothetical protein